MVTSSLILFVLHTNFYCNIGYQKAEDVANEKFQSVIPPNKFILQTSAGAKVSKILIQITAVIFASISNEKFKMYTTWFLGNFGIFRVMLRIISKTSSEKTSLEVFFRS